MEKLLDQGVMRRSKNYSPPTDEANVGVDRGIYGEATREFCASRSLHSGYSDGHSREQTGSPVIRLDE